MRRRLMVVLAALSLSAAGALSPEPEQVGLQLAELASGRPHLFVRSAGQSVRGRSLPLLLATCRPTAIESQLRVLVLARQHGDEQVPAEAVLLWLRQAAAQPALFEHLALLVLPTVNPDGAVAGTRLNAAGADLNRDWLKRSQPETRAVDAVFERWQPHVVLDLHSFHTYRDEGARSQGNWIESFRVGERAATTLDRLSYELADELVRHQRAAGERVDYLQTRLGSWSPSLAHRYFALERGALSLLCEVAEGRGDPEARVLGAAVERLGQQASELKPRLDALRGLSRWRAPRLETPAAARPTPPAPAPPVGPPTVPVSWAVAALGLMSVTRIKSSVYQDDRE